ncbi:MAG: hypothetical protein AAFV86_22140, partial [Pseudomonadota bacterium]
MVALPIPYAKDCACSASTPYGVCQRAQLHQGIQRTGLGDRNDPTTLGADVNTDVFFPSGKAATPQDRALGDAAFGPEHNLIPAKGAQWTTRGRVPERLPTGGEHGRPSHPRQFRPRRMNIPLRPGVQQRSLNGNGIAATMTREGARAGRFRPAGNRSGAGLGADR